MKSRILLLAFTAACYLTACTNQQNQSADCQKTIDSLEAILNEDHSSEVAAIMKADSAWDRASEAKSAEGWLSFYTDDAIMMPPGENVCKDKASREASIKNMFAIPGVSLRFQSTKVEVSRMGDLGYASGVYQWSAKDEKGKDYHETGKYCETWRNRLTEAGNALQIFGTLMRLWQNSTKAFANGNILISPDRSRLSHPCQIETRQLNNL